MNEHSVELDDISNFVNLKSLQKKNWIIEHPDRTLWMLDYLINITKDGKTKDYIKGYYDSYHQLKREVIPDIKEGN